MGCTGSQGGLLVQPKPHSLQGAERVRLGTGLLYPNIPQTLADVKPVAAPPPPPVPSVLATAPPYDSVTSGRTTAHCPHLLNSLPASACVGACVRACVRVWYGRRRLRQCCGMDKPLAHSKGTTAVGSSRACSKPWTQCSAVSTARSSQRTALCDVMTAIGTNGDDDRIVAGQNDNARRQRWHRQQRQRQQLQRRGGACSEPSLDHYIYRVVFASCISY
jgi:hypothetical protein